MASIVRRRREMANYAQFMRQLGPTFYPRLNELSGTAVVNYGSIGETYNGVWTPGAGALAQPGKISPVDAYLFDGADSKITFPAGVYGNNPHYTWAFLVNPSSAGEGNNGTFFYFVSATYDLRFNAGLTSLVARRGYAGGGAVTATATTTTGLAAGVWQWLFYTFDDAGDRKPHLYRGYQGTVTEYAYSVSTAGVGTLGNYSVSALVLGNRDTQNLTFAGLMDEPPHFDKVLTPTQLAQIVRLSGV